MTFSLLGVVPFLFTMRVGVLLLLWPSSPSSVLVVVSLFVSFALLVVPASCRSLGFVFFFAFFVVFVGLWVLDAPYVLHAESRAVPRLHVRPRGELGDDLPYHRFGACRQSALHFLVQLVVFEEVCG